MDPKWVRTIAIAVVVVVVAAGLGVYFYNQRRASAGCTLASTNPIVVDQAEPPDSLDPPVAITTPGWGIEQQLYQTLVMYNNTSTTSFQGLLAKNWTETGNGAVWTFTMWPGEHFSNGDPINAYVMWYSLNRGLIMNAGMVYIYEENFYVPYQNYYSNITNLSAENTTLVHQLNTFNFFHPTPPQVAVMNGAGQSFQVLNNLTIRFNVGYGYLGLTSYAYELAQIASPPYGAVDPAVIDAHGGVQAGADNSWMSINAMGSGPYVLKTYNTATGFTLAPNPDYWATALAAREPWNNNLQPAKSSIEVRFQTNVAVDISDLKIGQAAIASFAYLGPSTLNQLKGNSCITVAPQPPVFGGAADSWWVYMNELVPPFNNLSVRAAITHAINYGSIIDQSLGGSQNAQQWVGPVAPGYPDYNPGHLLPYQYNPTLAHQEMAASPWPHGYPKTLNFEYINIGPDWESAALIIQADLAAIGIHLNLVPLSIAQQQGQEDTYDPTTGECVSNETVNGGPFPIGLNYYAADYIAPDDTTQLDALSYGSYNACLSNFANTTVDNLVYQAAANTNPAQAAAEYAQITQIMYSQYADAWLLVPTFYAVYNNHMHGMVLNPMGSAQPVTMEYNTDYIS